jgi:hypothetical protein
MKAKLKARIAGQKGYLAHRVFVSMDSGEESHATEIAFPHWPLAAFIHELGEFSSQLIFVDGRV